jgi:PAS domain S-box-containing protein
VSRLTDIAGLDVDTEDFLGGVLGAAAQPIWVVDHDGVIRFANSAAIAALGYERADELLGRPSHETIHYQHADGTPFPAAECPMLLPRTTGETVSSELDGFFRRDGSMFRVSYVSVPLEMRDGRGAVVAFTDIEDRLAAEQALREHDAALAAQQASLRRVATLVAAGAASADVFAAVAEEVGNVTGLPLIAVWRYEPDGTATVLGAWSDQPHPFEAGTRWPLDGPTICARVLETGRPARIDDFAELPGTIAAAARETGIRGCAGAPIIIDGHVWGAMSSDSTDGAPLPDDIEDRLVEFTQLLAAAFSTTARQDELARLAEEQAALRRVATLVARGAPPAELFAAVVREVAELLDVSATHLGRYDADGTVTAVSSWSRDGAHMPVGTWSPLDRTTVSGLVFTTGRPARKDHYENTSAHSADVAQKLGIRASVAAPIVVDGKLWGVMIASSNEHEPLAEDTESRIAAFTELVATAISNTEARTEAARLAEEQAALRRVATLVAHGVPPGELFGAVTEEVGRLLGTDLAGMIRYETDATVTPVAAWAAAGEHPPLPDRWPIEEGDPTSLVMKTRRAARIDDWSDVPGPIAAFIRDIGIRSSVGSPILVEGRLWGALAVHTKRPQPLATDTESRLVHFAELVATAIANAQARSEVQRLADEQAALRRVATLVVRGVPAAEVFSAVAAELERLFEAQATFIVRLEPDETMTVVASSGRASDETPLGSRLKLESGMVLARVIRTGRSARVDDYGHASAFLGQVTQRTGIRCSVAVPIMVEGSLWGSMGAGTERQQFPANAEQRMAEFTELVGTAISSIQAREDLAASRARIAAAADEERRRVVRDLHDGAQQRLVHTIITLKLADRALQSSQEPGPELVAKALEHAERANVELRELAHGILPAVLTRGGLRAGVEALASRMPLPVEVAVSVDRLPAAVEATAYFVVAEALTNIAKHARATTATVRAQVAAATLELRVRDDGVGGARPEGSGLLGLADRLAALDGQLRIESPADRGTLIAADLPLPAYVSKRESRM